MDAKYLIGKRALIHVSDPFELSARPGEQPFYGRIVDLSDESLLIELESPVEYQDLKYLSALAQLRHEGSLITDLMLGSPLSVNITFLRTQERRFRDLTDVHYRNNLPAIGDLQLRKTI